MTKQVPEVIRSLSRERAPRFYNLTRNIQSPTTIEIGQIWSTYSNLQLGDLPDSSTNEPRLIIILTGAGVPSSKFDQVTVAPVSLNIWAATDYDLVVPENESDLNCRFIAEVWNETPVLKAHLKEYLGSLSESAIAVIRSIHVARLIGEDLPRTIRRWVGVPVMGESDSRIAFQQAEIEAVEYLANIATAAIFADIPMPASTPAVQQKLRFEIVPKFGNIQDLLKAPKRAFAASNLRAGNDLIIAYTNDTASLIFELLETRRESRVYLVVHEISEELNGQIAVITLVMTDQAISSSPAALYKGSEFEIGRIPKFNRTDIVRVDIDIEETVE